MGFDGKQYIRIAVKSQQDNSELISALEKLPVLAAC
jgi:histidinol-phosphate/aromatic aminotransferase/cobyric acid decarboxylase-like protein